MFERYNERARRVIFHARDEAMQSGSPYIETEHLLLGVLRENEALATQICGKAGSLDLLRKEIAAKMTIGQPVTGFPRDVPLSGDSKRVLLLTAEEADDLGHQQIALAHFLLGVLRMEKCIAAQILEAHGAELMTMRERTIRDKRWADGPNIGEAS